MEYQIASAGNQVKANIKGAITEADSEQLNIAFTELREASENKVVIDLKHVPTISSSGIGKLIALYRRLREQRKDFEINGIHENLHTLFTSIHLDKLFKIVE